MPAIYGQRSIAASSTTSNLLSGQVYEFIPADSQIEVGLTQSATGLITSIACDQDIVVQDVGESNLLVKTTAPIYPDDYFAAFVCTAGSRLVIAIRNTTAGALTVYYAVRITEI